MRGVYLETILDLARDRAITILEYLLEESDHILANAQKKPLPLDLQYLDTPDHSCVLVDPDGRIVYANPLACKLLRREFKKLRGRCAFALFPPDRAEPRKAILDEVVRTGHTYQYIDHDGEGHWFDARFIPIKQNGDVVQVVYLAMPLEHAPEPFKVRVIQ